MKRTNASSSDRLDGLQGKTPPRVAILVEASTGSARETLRGVAEFLQSHGVRWAIDHESRRLQAGPPPWLARWRGDGIIARIHSPKTMAVIARLGVPAVDLWGQPWAATLPHVHLDHRAEARLAAEHLFERGFRRFGFVGVGNVAWSTARAAAFTAAVGEYGCPCERFELHGSPLTGLPPTSRSPRLRDWLRRQSRPLGIMAANDFYAAVTAAACGEAELAVPEQVAIVGADNDEPVCELASPPLTSVSVNHRGQGFEAARLLDRLMAGRVSGKARIAIRPLGIVSRQSTAVLAIEDPVVAAALKAIRAGATGPLTIDAIAADLRISRAGLTRAFAAVVGHGIHEEIVRVRLLEARRLLDTTDLAIDAVARNSGFEHPQTLNRVFREKLGLTPGEYRRQALPNRANSPPRCVQR